MATITLSIGALTRSVTLSTPDQNRIVAAFKSRFGQSLTNQQAFDIWADSIFSSLKENVRNEELNASLAADTAAFVAVVLT